MVGMGRHLLTLWYPMTDRQWWIFTTLVAAVYGWVLISGILERWPLRP